MGWLFDRNETNTARFGPDLLADPDITRIDRQAVGWWSLSLDAPAALGGVISWSWWGALTALFWAGLVRIAVLHHVTWSINSICHMIGNRPFTHRDRSTNFWPLAVISMGESWHNMHHADPTCARHGVGRGQPDITARLIWVFENSAGPTMCAGQLPAASPASPPTTDPGTDLTEATGALPAVDGARPERDTHVHHDDSAPPRHQVCRI